MASPCTCVFSPSWWVRGLDHPRRSRDRRLHQTRWRTLPSSHHGAAEDSRHASREVDNDEELSDVVGSLRLVARAPQAHSRAILALATVNTTANVTVDDDHDHDDDDDDDVDVNNLLQSIISTSMDKKVSQWSVSSSSSGVGEGVGFG